ncbi:hypothetical protein BofuT4_P081600.1 [Botrytis cinerea T4]|uniref:Uncharacterized protein n=1 Tax=Botryotinia fuckeliana (strain T4) TaxID=999810 RepID=G2YK53_BOTF4|nr:hypothetical protein BofuT4_P081600.1 [Botrytis cinerea T4]
MSSRSPFSILNKLWGSTQSRDTSGVRWQRTVTLRKVRTYENHGAVYTGVPEDAKKNRKRDKDQQTSKSTTDLRCLWRGRSAFCILGLICSPCSANDARRIYVREQSTLVFIYQMVTFHMPYERKESAFQLHCVDIRPIHTLADE